MISTDDTASIVMTFQDRRIRAIKGRGLGVSGGRNTGLAAALGEFVTFLDHDDLWPAGRHFKLKQVLENDPQVGCRVRPHTDLSRSRRHSVAIGAGPRRSPHSRSESRIAHSFRSRFLRRIDGFDESLHFGEDVDYFLRLQEAGMRISLCDTDGLIYRRHASNCTDDQLAVNNSIFDVIKRRANWVSTSTARKRG